MLLDGAGVLAGAGFFAAVVFAGAVFLVGSVFLVGNVFFAGAVFFADAVFFAGALLVAVAFLAVPTLLGVAAFLVAVPFLAAVPFLVVVDFFAGAFFAAAGPGPEVFEPRDGLAGEAFLPFVAALLARCAADLPLTAALALASTRETVFLDFVFVAFLAVIWPATSLVAPAWYPKGAAPYHGRARPLRTAKHP